MKIEWASNFTPDGRRRNPPPSTIHGWLAKWRGTIAGNEVLRSRGMAEMRKAASHRRARKRYDIKKAAKHGTPSPGLLSIFRRNRTGNRVSARSRAHSSRSPNSSPNKGSKTSRRLTTRKPDSKSVPRTTGQKRSPPRSRPKVKPQQTGSRRLHGRN